MVAEPQAIAQVRSRLDKQKNEDITREGGQKGEGLETCKQSSRQLEVGKRAAHT